MFFNTWNSISYLQSAKPNDKNWENEKKNQTLHTKKPDKFSSQIRMVLSSLQDAITARKPDTPVSTFQAMPKTLPVWPSSFWISFSSKSS